MLDIIIYNYMILNGIKTLDVLGIEFQFKIKESDLYKTVLGGFLTVLLAILFFISVWAFGRDIIEKQNPIFIQTEYILDHVPTIKINNSNFFFAIRLSDESGGVVDDPRFLEPIFRYQHFVQNKTTSDLEIVEEVFVRMTKCSTDLVDNKTLYKEGLNSYFCHDLKNISLGGGWDEKEVGVISYQVKKCDNETEYIHSITCASHTEISDKYGSKFWVETKNLNWIINPTNITHPLTPQYLYSFQALSLDVQKRKDFYYSIAELLTDIGLVTTEYNKTSFNIFQKAELDFREIESNNAIYSIDILLSKLRSESLRTYIKAQNIAATIGGFFNLAFYLFKMTYYLYVENHMQHFFYKELLDLNIETEESKILNCNEEVIEKDKNFNQISSIIPFRPNTITHVKEDNSFIPEISAVGISTDFKMINITENEANKNNTGMIEMIVEGSEKSSRIKRKKGMEKRLKTISEYAKKQREKLKYDKWKLFKFRHCMCKNEKLINKRKQDKNQVFYLAEYNISKRLDALTLLKTMDQFKVLKQIVLNQDQCFMLENRGKKTITNIKLLNKGDFTKVIQEKSKLKEMHLSSYLADKYENNSHDYVDLMLYDLLELEIKKKLDEIGIKL